VPITVTDQGFLELGPPSPADRVDSTTPRRHARRVRIPCAAFCLLGLAWLACAQPSASLGDRALRPWTDYRVIMWVGNRAWQQPDKVPLFLDRLREMGVDTAMAYGADAAAQPYLDRHFPYYVENIVNRGLCLKWNSSVTDWDKHVTAWAKNGRPETAYVRDYCLDDPEWLEWARDQMRAAARRHGPNAPLAYDIRDELSVTVSANPFDYDFAPAALAGFRVWLRTQYRDLDALNDAWATSFAAWDDVRPFTTDQIKHRMASGEASPRGNPDWQALQRLDVRTLASLKEPVRWNLAPWCDFRTYMDLCLERTLDALRQAARAIDPETPVGIEGTQMPHAFGGYDLARLARALDWVEPYDIGNAREIFGSFMPGRPILATVFEKETNPARRRLWHLLLEGDRGCIIWWSEDCIDWDRGDYPLTPKALALAPVLRELRSPLARLFLEAERERDPIYIHYSQPSIQVNWLLESTVDGSTWHRRFSSFEASHNRQAKVRNAWLKALQDLGWSPQFIAADRLVRLEPDPATDSTLVLPQSWAMSDPEIEAVRRLVHEQPPHARPAPRRAVLCSGAPGLFDEHGRLLASHRLDGLFPRTIDARPAARHANASALRALDLDLAAFPAERLARVPDSALWRWLHEQIGCGPIRVPVEARARVHRFRIGDARLVAIERNIDYHMSEDLEQAGGNDALEQPIETTAELTGSAGPLHVYDLRAGRHLGRVSRWTFTLDPWSPSLFALLEEPRASDGLIEALLESR